MSAFKEFSREPHAYYQQVAVLQSALFIDLNKSECWGTVDSDWSTFRLLEAWPEFSNYLKSAPANCEVVSTIAFYCFWNVFFFPFHKHDQIKSDEKLLLKVLSQYKIYKEHYAGKCQKKKKKSL